MWQKLILIGKKHIQVLLVMVFLSTQLWDFYPKQIFKSEIKNKEKTINYKKLIKWLDYIGCPFEFILKVGVEKSIVNAPLVSLQSKNINNAKSEVRFKQKIETSAPTLRIHEHPCSKFYFIGLNRRTEFLFSMQISRIWLC
jgi:hypothetical protein